MHTFTVCEYGFTVSMIGVTWMHNKRMDNKRMDNKRMDNKTANAQEIMCRHSTNSLQHTATHCNILQHAATHTATRTAQYHVDAQQDSACTARQCIHNVLAVSTSLWIHDVFATQWICVAIWMLWMHIETVNVWGAGRVSDTVLVLRCRPCEWHSEATLQGVWVA